MTRSVLGRRVSELVTPALLLDIDDLDFNIARMAAFAAAHGVAVRPHVKNFKSVDIARRQLAAGAIGVTSATSRDARAMLDAGIAEVLIANQIVGEEKLDILLTDLPHGARPILAVDSEPGALALAAAAIRAGITLDVIIELDVGMTRGGARDAGQALELAGLLATLPALRLIGVMGYEGHTVLVKDEEVRAANTVIATQKVADIVEALRGAGHTIDIVAAGGTNTHETTALSPVVTELQAGTYVGGDVAYSPYIPGYRQSMTVIAQVVSIHGDRVILDAGGKTFGYSDMALPRAISDAITVTRLNDEHTICDLVPGATPPAIGDRIRLVVASAGLAVLMNVQFIVVKDDIVIDVWPMIGKRPDDYTALPGAEL